MADGGWRRVERGGQRAEGGWRRVERGGQRAEGEWRRVERGGQRAEGASLTQRPLRSALRAPFSALRAPFSALRAPFSAICHPPSAIRSNERQQRISTEAAAGDSACPAAGTRTRSRKSRRRLPRYALAHGPRRPHA